jgi:hypothetical protein
MLFVILTQFLNLCTFKFIEEGKVPRIGLHHGFVQLVEILIKQMVSTPTAELTYLASK